MRILQRAEVSAKVTSVPRRHRFREGRQPRAPSVEWRRLRNRGTDLRSSGGREWRCPTRQFVVVALALVFASQAAARQTQPLHLFVSITSSEAPGGAGVRVDRPEFYLGAPSAGVPGARRAVSFTITAWKEGDKARATVHAELRDDRAPGGFTQTPIATFGIAAGESVVVREAEKWGSTPVTVSAALR